MTRFVPVKITQAVEEGEPYPCDLGWKELGPLRILDVSQDCTGNTAMEIGCRNVHVRLVASRTGGITVYRDDKELVECS